ncbi:MAG: carbamoyltransferase HypF [bacterium]|nr:carbamoyltransferase HypF [bacterium]
MSERVRVEIEGAVQGVGFRPFVHRLATQLGLAGWVRNDTRGVVLEVEGDGADVQRFLARLREECPSPARIEQWSASPVAPESTAGFEIVTSEAGGQATAQMLPDLATCDACLGEVSSEADRRHRYPFANCTHCGPRLSIIRSLPYDRARTSMHGFAMCAECRAEYDDPRDRRFHAQPNACPVCGPQLELWTPRGEVAAERDAALRDAARAIREGRIVAVKGLGGFHLMVDARDGEAVGRLRDKKPRREKPFALMARDLEQAGRLCEIDGAAQRLLLSPAAPIVLMPRRCDAPVHQDVAPGNPALGVMLPATPLHHLLLRELDAPVVATSGNASDEPICTDEREALERLGDVAELFLVHDRPIVRHVDDSVARVVSGAETILRRARGYAPRPVRLQRELPPLLAVGAHLKNAVAFAAGRQVHVSQHIGDMETPQALAAFRRVVADFLELYEARPVAVAHDAHPDYVTTTWAVEQTAAAGALAVLNDVPRIAVQHHHAHLAACLAEHDADGPALGVTWDGTGFGVDGTIWGGEFLLGDSREFERVAHLRPFRLPGGDAAVREPRRSAASLLFELDGAAALLGPHLTALGRDERTVLGRMLERGINSPLTSSAGRLFDGVAALLGLHPVTTFEGQAAMALEWIADVAERGSYPIVLAGERPAVVDWRPLIGAVVEEVERGVAAETISARFHNTLVEAVARVAGRVGCATVALTGGCFQNALLAERTTERLQSEGFRVLFHRAVPPNDGGIALGQIAVAAARLDLENAL